MFYKCIRWRLLFLNNWNLIKSFSEKQDLNLKLKARILLRPNWINSKLTYIQINEKEKTCIKSIFLFNYPYGILKYKALEFKK